MNTTLMLIIQSCYVYVNKNEFFIADNVNMIPPMITQSYYTM